MEKKLKIIIIFLIVFLPIFLFILNFRLLVFDENYYISEFKKYDAYSTFPEDDVEKINHDVLMYLQDKKTKIDNNFFNQKEISHLVDVKNIMNSFNILFYCLLAVFLFILIIYKKMINRYFGVILVGGGILTLFLSLMLWLMTAINFSGFFTYFHEIFFSRGSWLFGDGDKIASLYTAGFFYDITYKIAINTVISAIILLIIGVILIYKLRKIKS